ncbi:unnamed protein product [Rotaria sordida]|uniref:Uncharacterized protein n=1 Tax=Rotaria sordida TaxID=392033 RepID=A0A815HBN9_9BILA|nr:unnamed protein product [Rotaria sordida]CAF1350035.1 unnamed protein product [Rotaria sordida]
MFILSNALPSWGVLKVDGKTLAEGGLWQDCGYIGTWTCVFRGFSCSGLPSPLMGECIKLIMTRVFIILACLVSAFGATNLLQVARSGGNNPQYIMSSKVCAAVSVLCGILSISLGISWALYGGVATLGAAAALGIVATVLSLFSTVVAFMIR